MGTSMCLHTCETMVAPHTQVCRATLNCGLCAKELLKALLHDYERQHRLVLNETEPLVLTFGVTLWQIIDVVSFALSSHGDNNEIHHKLMKMRDLTIILKTIICQENNFLTISGDSKHFSSMY